jgi:hypothetical protein
VIEHAPGCVESFDVPTHAEIAGNQRLMPTMSAGEQPPEEDFPTTETFPDFAGKKHTFVIELLVQPSGYFVRAHEEPRSELDEGYTVAAYSPTDPFFALGLLRSKIRRGLSNRYFRREKARTQMSQSLWR